ncbi:tetratricopeptide repeat protein [Thermophagus sp. OGC60D27]|uniref:tetratricopeptide repeat protein n=1 Tax=Thermophagus sp. OGC60D27 TaxID=3458415 RepID=UPI0040382064
MYKCLIYLLLLVFFLESCHTADIKIRRHLVAIDSLIYQDPKIASDSLKKMTVDGWNGKNEAYYNLLKTIVDLKLNRSFGNDSCISKAVKVLKVPIPDKNFVRAVIYQSIIRYHSDQYPDSVIFFTLKDVEKIVDNQPGVVSNNSLTYLWFYIGLLHRNNNNHDIAEEYFNRALENARTINDVESVIGASLGIFWNSLRNREYDDAWFALSRLDSLKGIPLERQFDIVNAKGAYCIMQGDNAKALEYYRNLIDLTAKVNRKPRMSNLYYSMALAHEGMNNPDSVIFYAHKAIDSINDTIKNKYDYHHLYSFLAGKAYEEGKFRMAAETYKEAFKLLINSVDRKTQKQIFELEKKYDLSKAQIDILKERQKFQQLAFIGVVLTIVGLFLFLLYFLNLRRSRLELDNERLLRMAAEKEVENNIRDNHQKKHLLDLYRVITKRENNTQKRFGELSQRFVKDNPDIYNDLHEELKRLKSEFFNLLKDLIDDDTFYAHLQIPQSINFTDIEKLILFLLYFKMPGSEITKVLGITPNNLRVRKSAIKKKLFSVANEQGGVDELLKLF